MPVLPTPLRTPMVINIPHQLTVKINNPAYHVLGKY